MVDGEKDGAEVAVMVGVVGVLGRLVVTPLALSLADMPVVFPSLCAAGCWTSLAKPPGIEEVPGRAAPRGREERRSRRRAHRPSGTGAPRASSPRALRSR